MFWKHAKDDDNGHNNNANSARLWQLTSSRMTSIWWKYRLCIKSEMEQEVSAKSCKQLLVMIYNACDVVTGMETSPGRRLHGLRQAETHQG